MKNWYDLRFNMTFNTIQFRLTWSYCKHFYGPCNYDDYPEIVIVMNLFEGPELVSIFGFPWGPKI